jgi:hypothetical protein
MLDVNTERLRGLEGDRMNQEKEKAVLELERAQREACGSNWVDLVRLTAHRGPCALPLTQRYLLVDFSLFQREIAR